MRSNMGFWRRVGILATVVVLAGIVPASGQTNGMERRDQRRDNRSAARSAKQACKAGDEKTRADCRKMKRDVKQAGRNDEGGNANTAPSTQPAH